MPVYDFVCAGCGPFEQWRPAAQPTAHVPEVVSRPTGRPLHVHHGHAH